MKPNTVTYSTTSFNSFDGAPCWCTAWIALAMYCNKEIIELLCCLIIINASQVLLSSGAAHYTIYCQTISSSDKVLHHLSNWHKIRIVPVHNDQRPRRSDAAKLNFTLEVCGRIGEYCRETVVIYNKMV